MRRLGSVRRHMCPEARALSSSEISLLKTDGAQVVVPAAAVVASSTTRRTVYLASGLGFSAQQRALVLPELVAALEQVGATVFEPFVDNAEGAKTAIEQPPGWAYRIGQADLQAVRDCDAVMCWANFNPPDEGAMIELGAAIALGKKTFIFRDDFRLNAPCEDYPLNLMLFTGMPADDWRDHYYTSVEELADPTKAFARWCTGEDVYPFVPDEDN